MFKNPQGRVAQKNNIIFSEFLSEVDNGRVVKVEIQGNNINGVMSNGEKFTTYSPNDPNLIEKLSDKGVSISAAPIDEKMRGLTCKPGQVWRQGTGGVGTAPGFWCVSVKRTPASFRSIVQPACQWQQVRQ